MTPPIRTEGLRPLLHRAAIILFRPNVCGVLLLIACLSGYVAAVAAPGNTAQAAGAQTGGTLPDATYSSGGGLQSQEGEGSCLQPAPDLNSLCVGGEWHAVPSPVNAGGTDLIAEPTADAAPLYGTEEAAYPETPSRAAGALLTPCTQAAPGSNWSCQNGTWSPPPPVGPPSAAVPRIIVPAIAITVVMPHSIATPALSIGTSTLGSPASIGYCVSPMPVAAPHQSVVCENGVWSVR